MLRLRHQLVCDDVRIENNSKLLVIGLYLDTIVIPDLPTVLRPLTLLHIFEAEQIGVFEVLIQLSGPEGKAADSNTVRLDVRQPGIVAGIIKMPVQINAVGKYVVSGTGEGVLAFEEPFNVILPAGKL